MSESKPYKSAQRRVTVALQKHYAAMTATPPRKLEADAQMRNAQQALSSAIGLEARPAPVDKRKAS